MDAVFSSISSDTEVIAVDDCSSDSSSGILKEFPCKVITMAENSGPAASRNAGAENSSGETLIFLDSDVLVFPESMSCVSDFFERNNKVHAIQGIYDMESEKANLPTLARDYFKFHKLSKLKQDEILGINSFCFAIRKEVFDEVGGFNEKIKTAASEDTDFAMRLAGSGYKILLEKNLKVRHLKSYSLPGLLGVDFYKAKAKMKLILRRRGEGKAPVTISLNRFRDVIPEIISVFISPLFFLSAGLSIFYGKLFALFSLCALAFFWALNYDYFSMICKNRGYFISLGCFFIFLFEMSFYFSGIIAALIEYIVFRRRY